MLANAFLAVFRFDELEDGVTEVVDETRVPAVPIALELGHLGHDVGDGRIAHHHQVERRPLAAFVVRETFVHPQRHAAANQTLRNDVELEDVRELVRDQASLQTIWWIVDRQQHPVAIRFGEGADAFDGRTRRDVLLFELAMRLEQDERNLERQVVFQIGADLLIRPFGIPGDPLEMLLDIRVVVDLEVVGRVDVPLKLS